MKIALWGYKLFGKRTSESLLKYWGGRYSLTRIYDPSRAGERDPFWDIEVADPGQIKADYEAGLFEKIMICVIGRVARDRIKEELIGSGVPVLFTGNAADFISVEDFGAETVVRADEYRIYRCRDVMTARPDQPFADCIYIFNEEGRILIDPWVVNDWYDHDRSLVYPFRLKDPVPERIRIPGQYCLLTKIFGNNYWHFTFQNLCDVYILEEAGFTGKYIIGEAPYIRELMLMMGIAPERVVSQEVLPLHRIHVFGELYGVEMDRKDQDLNTALMTRVSARIRSRLKADPSYPRYIYVKRIGSRKLLNGDEAARKYGFVTIVPEELSVEEQMEHFFNADIVLCPHGANSTNCLYMHEGSVFIEIFSDRWYLDLNADVCRENGIHHIKVVGTAVGREEEEILDDYLVPPENIASAIEKAYDILGVPVPVPEETDDAEMTDLKSICGRAAGILIYGAWTLGKQAFDMLGRGSKEKFLGFAVTSMEGNPEELCGCPVRPLEEWREVLGDRNILPEQVVVIMALHAQYCAEVQSVLQEKGFRSVFGFADLECCYYERVLFGSDGGNGS